MTLQIMVDIETLSAQPNAAIVSIGAVKFTWDEGVLDSFLINIDPVSCKKYDLRIDKETLKWWMQQPKEVRRLWMENPVSLETALSSFTEWFGSSDQPIWANGTNFDIPILEEAYIRTNNMKPWLYWNVNDYRTVLTLFGLSNKKLRKGDNTYHSALDDATFQANTLVELLKEFKTNAV